MQTLLGICLPDPAFMAVLAELGEMGISAGTRRAAPLPSLAFLIPLGLSKVGLGGKNWCKLAIVAAVLSLPVLLVHFARL